MARVFLVFCVLICFSRNGNSQNEGESCVDKYTNTVGRCALATRCQTAREDFQRNGIRPTFCGYTADGPSVCCRDGNSILQTPPPTSSSNSRPIWSSSSHGTDRRSVSQRKCEEYSRQVVQTVDFLPLLPDPETISISTSKCNYVGVELIVGGQSAELAEFPHMAAIGWSNFEGGYSWNCGGSLISPRWVLTAGHCTRDPRARDPSPVVVRLGDHNINPAVDDGARPVDVAIKSIKKHPEYQPPKRYNDIALLELATDVEFSNEIRAACLWRNEHIDQPKAIATGWGVTDPRKPQTSEELQKVSLTLLENDYCDQLLASSKNRNWAGFAPTQLCAGELRGGKDTCQGDSGAPLQIASKENQCIFQIVGITSFGHKCAQSGKPAIYTRVSAYVDWIESIVWRGEH